MNEQLKEWLPNPTFVDYQIPHDGQGADFYDEEKMLEYGRRIVKECSRVITQGGYWNHALKGRTQASPPEIAKMIEQYFGVEE